MIPATSCPSCDELRRENDSLRQRLQEAVDTIEAIRRGEVDSLVIRTPRGDRVFTLTDAHSPYLAFVEQMQQGAATLGPDGTVLYCNRSLAALLGEPLERVVGRNFATFVAAQDRDLLGRLLAVPPDGASSGELRLLAAGGLPVPVNLTATPMSADGILATCLVITDLTERKQAEDALRISEERFRSVFETAQIGMALTSPEGRLLHVNRSYEEMVGYSAQELKALSLLDITHPDDRQRTREIVEDLAAGRQEVQHFEKRYLRKDGGIVWVHLTDSAVRGPDGKPRFLVGMAVDITDRRRAEEEIHALNTELEQRVRQRTAELEAANQELEGFTYSVSHDLRAPLRGIDGFSQILLAECPAELSEQARHYLHMVADNARQMGRLVDDLLRFSRTSRQSLLRQRVAMASLVRQCLAELAPESQGRDVDLQVGELPDCLGDPALLKQVWLNLLSNAFKFTRQRQHARIDIGCLQRDGQTVYFVRDNGVGFDMQYADKLFGVFQRLHRAEEFEGTGIGLALVQRIVHRHGGRIWADAAPDQGATFYFTLQRNRPHV